MPLSFVADHLTLTDSIEFSFADAIGISKDPNDPNQRTISSGTLVLITDNGFPLDADVQLNLYDEAWTYLDTLFANTLVNGGELDNACLVITPNRSKLRVPFDADKLNLLENTAHAIIHVSFTNAEQCRNEYVKIYSDYQFDIRLVGDFNYFVGKREE